MFIFQMSVGNFLRSFDLPSDDESDPLTRKVHYEEADIYLASRIGDVTRVRYLIEEEEVDINKRDFWDSVPLYYACLTGHIEVVKLLIENGAICSENTFDGDRCLYGALTLKIRHLLESSDVNKTPPLKPLAKSIRRLCSICDDPEQPISESAVFHELTDLELKLEQEVYSVNKAILAARLTRFDEILSQDFQKSCLSIGGGEANRAIWESLLIYVYSERLDLDMKDVDALRKLAKHYGCPALIKMTDKELLSIKYYFKTLKKKSAPKRFVLYPYSFPEEASLEHDLGLLRQRSRTLEVAVIQGGLTGATNDLADVLLDLEGVQFRAHSCVLCCRSDYFLQRILLCSEHGFQTPPRIQCPLFGQSMAVLVFLDVDCEALKVVLEYLYTERVESLSDSDLDNLELVSNLFQLANRLLVFGMKRRIAERLKKLDLIFSRKCELLMLADFYDVVLLRDFCLSSLAKQLDEILQLEEGEEMKDYFEAFVVDVAPKDFQDAAELFDSSATKGDFHGVIDGNHVGGIGSNSILEDLREKYLELSNGDEDQRDQDALLFDDAFLHFTRNAVQKRCRL